MEFNFWLFVLDNLEAAGAIGGYVSLSIIGFALFTYISKKKFNKVSPHIGPKYLHPIIGSFMGAIPGCGATIVVASLYKNNKISFGGLFAAFISTLGEGSFVLLGASNEADVIANIKAYAIITIFGLIAGIVFGYLLDLIKFKSTTKNQQSEKIYYNQAHEDKNNMAVMFVENFGFYSIVLMSIFLAPNSIMALWGGSFDFFSELNYLISIALTLTCAVYYLVNKFIYKYHDCSSSFSTYKTTMLHAVLDVAMVVTYVFIGLFIANYLIDEVVGTELFSKWMTSSHEVVVFLAALIAVTPGCGGMIAVAVAFITIPNFPISALIAAAIATSGDGIFPLLAENKKDGFIISLFGLIIALLVGYIALFIGV